METDGFPFYELLDDMIQEIRAHLCKSAALMLTLTCKREAGRPGHLLRALVQDGLGDLALRSVSCKGFAFMRRKPHKLKHDAIRARHLPLIRFLMEDPYHNYEHKSCAECFCHAVRTGSIKIIEVLPPHTYDDDLMNVNQVITTAAIHENNVKILGWLASKKKLPRDIHTEWPSSMGLPTPSQNALDWWDAIVYLSKQSGVIHIGEYKWHLLESMISRQWTWADMDSFFRKDVYSVLGHPTRPQNWSLRCFRLALRYSNKDILHIIWRRMCNPNTSAWRLLKDGLVLLKEEDVSIREELLALARPPASMISLYLGE